MSKTEKKLLASFLLIPLVIIIGTFGYMFIENWSFFDSLYMTIITISTTGFKEVKNLSGAGRLLTIILILSSIFAILNTSGRALQLLFETKFLRRKRMQNKIDNLKGHYLVCGFGRMGRYISEGLSYNKVPFVIIDNDPSKSEELDSLGYLYMIGDSSNDEVLISAGINRAAGLVAVVKSDAENVFTTLTAKGINPSIFVVARAIEDGTEPKLIKAGADRVVKPYDLGGNRMVQLLLRPGVSDFIDLVARKRGMDIKLEEIELKKGSVLLGQTLAESPIRKELNIMIIAVARKGEDYIYNPKSSFTLKEGDKLIAIGEWNNLNKLTELCINS